MSAEVVVPVKIYVAVFVALILLTGLTTGVAYIDMGAFNTVVALAIAAVKMTLVLLFFMHLKYASGMTRLVLFAAIIWLGILISFTLADELTRTWTPNAGPWGLLLPFLNL